MKESLKYKEKEPQDEREKRRNFGTIEKRARMLSLKKFDCFVFWNIKEKRSKSRHVGQQERKAAEGKFL